MSKRILKHKLLSAIDDHSFPIAAIGASAGGLEAIELFLEHLPVKLNVSFVVIQHLDPTQKCMLPELLKRVTSMPVIEVKDRMKVKSGCVYVIPPNQDLSLSHDRLYLSEPIEPRGLRLPIDFFFKSLADARRERAIGIIFSGMGADGSHGIKAIKERGGIVLAQDPSSAKFDSMPRSAIDTGLVDYIAAVDVLARRFPEFTLTTHPINSKTEKSKKAESELLAQKSSFDKICTLIRTETGHDFSLYKKSTL